MAARVSSLRLNRAAIAALCEPNGPVYKATKAAADVTVQRGQNNITRMGRVKSGTMRRTFGIKSVRSNQQGVTFTISSGVGYDIFQHDGTRKGVTPAPFARDALRSLSVRDFTPQP